MGVFMRAGENTAVGFSWPVYFFLILPTQLLIVWPFKLLVWFCRGLAWACVAIFTLAVAAVRELRARDAEERPPA